MALIEGDRLALLQRLFGISSQDLRQPTDLDVANVSLTMPISPEILRRSVTIANLGGWYQGTLENVHAGADDQVSAINPYAAGASAVAPYPADVPEGFDVWLLGVSGVRSSGAGGLTGARISVNPGAFQQGWGEDQAGLPVVSDERFTLAFFDGLETTVTGLLAAMISPTGQTWFPLKFRIARGNIIAFHTEAAAAAEFQALFLMGLFPAGLGQDVLG